MDKISIRESNAEDWVSLASLYPAAFPDEDLLPLVGELLQERGIALSLVACVGSDVVGHIVFTSCRIDSCDAGVSLLGPLAVAPAWQRKGIGTALIRAGLERAEATRVYVLGDPAYYGRFGFTPDANVEPPFPLPEEWAGAWQSRGVRDSEHVITGKLTVPKPWRKRDLWAE